MDSDSIPSSDFDPTHISGLRIGLPPALAEWLRVVVDRICRQVLYTASMRIPHTQLSPAALQAVVEEFVTRDGTDHSSVERRIETVLRQLDAGRVELHFDAEAETCPIVPVEGNSAEGGAE